MESSDEIAFFNWRPGIAVADREAGSTDLFVFNPLDMPFIADDTVDEKTSAVEIKYIPTNGGDECGSGLMEIGSAVKATYIGRSNMSTPCIVKGETVLISPHVNGIYYWKETGINDQYRKLESFYLRIANKAQTLLPLTELNSYGLTLNSISKIVSLYITPLLPNEVGYSVRFDALKGFGSVADTRGNSFSIDSNKGIVKLMNNTMSSVILDKENIKIEALGNIEITAGKGITINAMTLQENVNSIAMTGVDTSITTTGSTVIQSPVVGVNGVLAASGGVMSGIISGTALTIGAPPAPLTPITIPEPGTTAGGQNIAPPVMINPAARHTTAAEQFIMVVTNILAAIAVVNAAIPSQSPGQIAPMVALATASATAAIMPQTTGV